MPPTGARVMSLTVGAAVSYISITCRQTSMTLIFHVRGLCNLPPFVRSGLVEPHRAG